MAFLSYKMVRDYGFAPNPFHGVCTLATCKPQVRKAANEEDWIIGTGAVTRQLEGRLIYLMKVNGVLTFNEYWEDRRFQCKKPVANGSLTQIHGDNIYHSVNGNWIQVESQHSLPNGESNEHHIKTDTSGENVLFSYDYYYFGDNNLELPEQFLEVNCPAQGFKYVEQDLGITLVDWVSNNYEIGIHGNPIDWKDYRQRTLFFM